MTNFVPPATDNRQLPTESCFLWDHEVAAITDPPADWLWQGYIAKGNITLLTSLWKAGKTTLLSLLLSARKQGGFLAGLAVRPGKSLIVTEEHPRIWAGRARRYDFGGLACFISRPFLTVPTLEQWQALIDRILAFHDQHGIDLVAIDPLAPFLRCENAAADIFQTLLPLAALTQKGIAVLVLHHPKKSESTPGYSARGSGALLGHVDISLEMRHPGGDPLTRRRRFIALSRHADTPRQRLLELNQEGNDYVPVPPDDDGFLANWDVLRMVLEDAPQKLTRRDILLEWPEDFARPTPKCLARWLNQAGAAGHVSREGSGRRADPFRYWLPAREAIWKQDPYYEDMEQQRLEFKVPWISLHLPKKQ